MSSLSPAGGSGPDKSRRRSLQRFVSKLVKGKKDKSTAAGEAGTSWTSATTTAPTTTPTITETPALAPTDAATPTVAVPQEVTIPAVTTVAAGTSSTAKPAAAIEPPIVPETQIIAVDDSDEHQLENLPSEPISRGSGGQTWSALSAAERARLIAAKHGVELSEEWAIPNKPVGERVEKQIRMRVHRFCHKCQTSFGSEKVCANCAHKRCTKCPRTPLKAGKELPKRKEKKKDPYAGLTRPSRTGGQDLVHKEIRQRVHRTCHKCEIKFGSAKECPNCSHVRCKKCPRDPKPKDTELKTDVTARRRPFKWTCHECQAKGNATKNCLACKHERCKKCPRESTKRQTAIPKTGPQNEATPADPEQEPSSIMTQIEHALNLTTIS